MTSFAFLFLLVFFVSHRNEGNTFLVLSEGYIPICSTKIAHSLVYVILSAFDVIFSVWFASNSDC